MEEDIEEITRPEDNIAKEENFVVVHNVKVRLAVNGQLYKNKATYKGIPIMKCPSQSLKKQAEPENEFVLHALSNVQLEVYMARLAKNTNINTTEMLVVPRPGQVYLFSMSKTLSQSHQKLRLMNCDDYVWYNNSDNKEKRTKYGYFRTYYVNRDINDQPTDFRKRLYIHPTKPLAMLHYMGQHTTGLTKPDKYFIQAIKNYQIKLEQERQLRDSTPSHDSETDLSKARVEESRLFEKPKEPQQPSFDANLRAALDPFREDRSEISAAIPAYVNVSTPGVIPNFRQFTHILLNGDDKLFDYYENFVIHKPKNGDIYCFSFQVPDDSFFEKKGKNRTYTKNWYNHVSKDGFHWKKLRDLNEPGVPAASTPYKLFIKGENGKPRPTSAFRKYIFVNHSKLRVIVYYNGENEAFENAHFVHGNNTTSTKIFHSSSALVKEAILAAPANLLPNEVYQMLNDRISAEGIADIVAPRNARQVRYVRSLTPMAQTKAKVSEILKVQAVCDAWPEIVFTHNLHPELHLVVIPPSAVGEMERISLLSLSAEAPVIFHYDTTFNCGRSYVSILSMRHPLLIHTDRNKYKDGTGEPTIPLAFMIHQTRVMETHQVFFHHVTQTFNNASSNRFETLKKVLVTDQEFNKDIWENANSQVVYCWRHIAKNIEVKAASLKLGKNLTNQAVQAFQDLAHSKNVQDFDRKLQRYLDGKAGAFANLLMARYMKERMVKIVRETSGFWHLEKFGVPNAHKGITNNPAEGINSAARNWLNPQAMLDGTQVATMETHRVIMGMRAYVDNEIKKVLMAHYGKTNYFTLKKGYACRTDKMPNIKFQQCSDVLEEFERIMQKAPDHLQTDDAQVEDPMEEELDIELKTREDQVIIELAAYFLSNKHEILKMDDHYIVRDDQDVVHTVFVGDNNCCSCETSGWCLHLIALRKHLLLCKDLYIPDFKPGRKRIPPPKHPYTRRKIAVGSKRPQATDKFHVTQPGKFKRKTTVTFRAKPGPKSKQSTQAPQQDTSARRDGLRKTQAPSYREEASSQESDACADEETQQDERQFVFTDPQLRKYQSLLKKQANQMGQSSAEERERLANLIQERTTLLQKQKKQHDATLRNIGPEDNWVKLLKENDVLYRKLRLNLKSFTHNHVKLNLNAAHYQRDKDKILYAFVRHKEHTVTIFCENQPPMEAIVFAARAMQHNATHETVFTVNYRKATDPKKEVQKKTHLLPCHDKIFQLRSLCYCMEPTLTKELNRGARLEEGSIPNLVQCKRCKVQYHEQCLDPEARITAQTKRGWECALHTIPTAGFQWGAGKITNTCTIDNFGTALTIWCKDSPAFHEYVLNFPYQEIEDAPRNIIASTLQKYIRYGLTGDDDHKAQKAYKSLLLHAYPALRQDIIDTGLLGNPNQFVWEVLEDAGTFLQPYMCIACGYSPPYSTQPKRDFSSDTESLQSVIETLEKGAKGVSECDSCKQDALQKRALQYKDAGMPPWFLNITLDTTAYRVRELLWCQRSLKIENDEYTLAFFTLRTPMPHFNAIINYQNQLLTYDGMRAPEGRFQRIPLQYLHEDYDALSVQSVTFFRKMDGSASPLAIERDVV